MINDNPEEIFKAMSAPRILVAILKKIESVSVTTEEFLSANENDVELAVEYNSETFSFEFKLKDKADE